MEVSCSTDAVKSLLYVLRRACSPCNKWGSVELAPDSPTGLRIHQRDDGVGSIGPRIMADALALCVSSVGVRPSAAAPGLSPVRRGEGRGEGPPLAKMVEVGAMRSLLALLLPLLLSPAALAADEPRNVRKVAGLDLEVIGELKGFQLALEDQRV